MKNASTKKYPAKIAIMPYFDRVIINVLPTFNVLGEVSEP
jgi:hypothetical protein